MLIASDWTWKLTTVFLAIVENTYTILYPNCKVGRFYKTVGWPVPDCSRGNAG